MYYGMTIAITCVSLASAVFAQDIGGYSPKVITADPQVQETIRQLMAAPIDSQKSFDRHLEPLRRIPQDELIRQLLVFAVNAKGTEEAMMPAVLMEQLKIPIQRITGALADYLQAATPSQRMQMENWLQGVEGQDREGPANFKPYIRLLERRLKNKEPLPLPLGLIDHMYRVDAQEAILSMMQLYELGPQQAKPLRWSEHVVRDAVWRKRNGFDDRYEEVKPQALAELDKLSQHEAWWARLYAAHIVQQHPELAAEGMAERLRRDKHELIREVFAPLR